MSIKFEFDTDNLSGEDLKVLAAISGALNGDAPAPAASAAPKSADKPPAKKSSPKPPAKADPEPEPEVDEPETSDDAGTDDELDRDAVVEKATKLVSSGSADVVRSALAEVGAKKVSEVKDKDLAKFNELISD